MRVKLIALFGICACIFSCKNDSDFNLLKENEIFEISDSIIYVRIKDQWYYIENYLQQNTSVRKLDWVTIKTGEDNFRYMEASNGFRGIYIPGEAVLGPNMFKTVLTNSLVSRKSVEQTEITTENVCRIKKIEVEEGKEVLINEKSEVFKFFFFDQYGTYINSDVEPLSLGIQGEKEIKIVFPGFEEPQDSRQFDTVYMINGYASIAQKEMYKQYSRPKEIEIILNDDIIVPYTFNEYFDIVALKVGLFSPYENAVLGRFEEISIRIRIKSWYKGTLSEQMYITHISFLDTSNDTLLVDGIYDENKIRTRILKEKYSSILKVIRNTRE